MMLDKGLNQITALLNSQFMLIAVGPISKRCDIYQNLRIATIASDDSAAAGKSSQC